MEDKRSEVLCWNCRKKVMYTIKARKELQNIKGIDYQYNEMYAVCDECHEEIMVPGLDDENIRELDIVFRKQNDLITIDEINLLMEKYNIEKRPLSRLLGLGELTITRYLEGQLPTKRYSDMLLRLLRYDAEMRKALEKGKQNITENAYRKVDKAIEEHEHMKSHNSKIEKTALYMLQSCYEITNMSLQKLLYYFKAFGYVLLNRDLLGEQCEAWIYGPVFPTIYAKYKKLGSQIIQIDLADIVYDELLEEEERKVCDYVLQCFGIYNAKFLRDMTHQEEPWRDARGGLGDMQPCANVIKDTEICRYFRTVNEKFDLSQKSGVDRYIDSLCIR